MTSFVTRIWDMKSVYRKMLKILMVDSDFKSQSFSGQEMKMSFTCTLDVDWIEESLNFSFENEWEWMLVNCELEMNN